MCLPMLPIISSSPKLLFTLVFTASLLMSASSFSTTSEQAYRRNVFSLSNTRLASSTTADDFFVGTAATTTTTSNKPQPTTQSELGTTTKVATPNVQQEQMPVNLVSNAKDFCNIIDDKTHEFVVMKYYASYCKVCQRTSFKYKKFVTQNKSEYNNFDFHKIEVSSFEGFSSLSSAEVTKSLGVTRFPFVQIYRHGLCVASFFAGPAHMFDKKFKSTMEMVKNRPEEEWNAFITEYQQDIASNVHARGEIRKLLNEEEAQILEPMPQATP